MAAKGKRFPTDSGYRSVALKIVAGYMIGLRLSYHPIGIRWEPSGIKEMHACELLEKGCLVPMFAPTNVGTSRVRVPS